MSIKQFSRLNYLTKNYNISSIVGEGSYSVTADTYAVNEGSAVTYTITTTGIPDGTTYYWTTAGTTVASDFTPATISGSVVITNNTGTVTRTLMEDLSTEGAETIIFQLRRDSISGQIMATSPTVDVADTSIAPAITPYAIIPVATTTGATTYTQYKFLNLGTYAIDYTVTSSASTGGNFTNLIRFGLNFILEYRCFTNGAYWVKNITTNTTTASGTFTTTYGTIGVGFDVIKFAGDKFGILYKNTTHMYLDTYTLNTTTGVISSKIATIDYGVLAADSSGGIQTPVGAASANISSTGVISSYNNLFFMFGAYQGSGSYPGFTAVGSIAADGTSGSLISTTGSNSTNYSRPSAGMGANGRVFIGLFDVGAYRIIDNTGTYVTSGNVSPGPGHGGLTGLAPAPILGTDNFMQPYQDYGTATMILRLVTTTGYSVSNTLTNALLARATSSFAWTLQAAPNGCIFIYTDSSNTVSYTRYDGSTWSSPAVLSSLGSVTVNSGGQLVRAYNFA